MMNADEGYTPRSRMRHEVRERRMKYFSNQPSAPAVQYRHHGNGHTAAKPRFQSWQQSPSSNYHSSQGVRTGKEKRSPRGSKQKVASSENVHPGTQKQCFNRNQRSDAGIPVGTTYSFDSTDNDKVKRHTRGVSFETSGDDDLEELTLHTHRPDLLDTSRTSEILVETSRNFKEVLREREELKSRSSQSTQPSPCVKKEEVTTTAASHAQSRSKWAALGDTLPSSDDESVSGGEEVVNLDCLQRSRSFDVDYFRSHGVIKETFNSPPEKSFQPNLEKVRVSQTADKVYHLANNMAQERRSQQPEPDVPSYEDHINSVRRHHMEMQRLCTDDEYPARKEVLNESRGRKEVVEGETLHGGPPRKEVSWVRDSDPRPKTHEVRHHEDEDNDSRSVADTCLSIGKFERRFNMTGIRSFIPSEVNLLNNDSVTMMKLCPECYAKNKPNLTWCMSCGCVLMGIDPEPVHRVRKASPREKKPKTMKSQSLQIVEDRVAPVICNAEASYDGVNRVKDQSCGFSEAYQECERPSLKRRTPRTIANTGASSEDVVMFQDESCETDIMTEPLFEEVLAYGGHRDTPAMHFSKNEDGVSQEPLSKYDDCSDSSKRWSEQSGKLFSASQRYNASTPDDTSNQKRYSPMKESSPLSTPRGCENPPSRREVPAPRDEAFLEDEDLDTSRSSISLSAPSSSRPYLSGELLEEVKLDLDKSLDSEVNYVVNDRRKKEQRPMAQRPMATNSSSNAIDISGRESRDRKSFQANSAEARGSQHRGNGQYERRGSNGFTDYQSRGQSRSGAHYVENVEYYNRNPPSSHRQRTFSGSGIPSRQGNRHRNNSGSQFSRPNSGAQVRPCSQNRQQWSGRQDKPASGDSEYQRRWATSSTAWNSQHPSALRKKPADYVRQSLSDKNAFYETTVAPRFLRSQEPGRFNARSNSWSKTESDHHPVTSGAREEECALERDAGGDPNCESYRDGQDEPTERTGIEESTVSLSQELTEETKEVLAQPSTRRSQTMAEVFAQKKRGWQPGESPWLFLPDEMWLHILSLLPLSSLAKVAQTCSTLYRIASDASLWRKISFIRRHDLTNEDVAAIGRRKPVELFFQNCHGDTVTLKGLKDMFMECGESLRKLSFISCSRGAFQGDQFLLLSAVYCQNLTWVDASYAQNVRDATIASLAEASLRLEALHLNGAQMITNDGIATLVNYHKDTLLHVELFGCFRLSSRALRSLAKCSNLRAVSLGSLTRLSADSIVEMTAQLPQLRILDIRGVEECKVTDSTISKIVAHCPNLEEVVLANIFTLTDAALFSMSKGLPHLRSLDICGCTHITSEGIGELAQNCSQLEYLDLSSTLLDQKGMSAIEKHLSGCLKDLRLNFCLNVKLDSLKRLITACKCMHSLFIYGVCRNDDVTPLYVINSKLLIKKDGDDTTHSNLQDAL